MGGNCSKYFSKEQQQQKKKSKAVFPSNCGKSSSNEESKLNMELINSECLKTKNKNQMNKQKISKLNPSEKRMGKVCRKFTLEEWLLASPGPASMKSERFKGGELYVFKQFSQRVHPSSSSSSSSRIIQEKEAAFTTSNAGETSLISCSSEVSSATATASSISRSQNGKLKKKVRFKLPEKADVILFHSPPDTIVSDYESS